MKFDVLKVNNTKYLFNLYLDKYLKYNSSHWVYLPAIDKHHPSYTNAIVSSFECGTIEEAIAIFSLLHT